MAQLAEDLGVKRWVRVHTDSSAALVMVKRKGLGKVRHISLRYLWVQEKVQKGIVTVEKCPTDKMLADLGTKHLSAPRMRQLLKMLGYVYLEGRAAGMPKLVANLGRGSARKREAGPRKVSE